MKFKSQLVTQASGSLGGVTFSHNAGGLYTRARSIPVNPSSVQQQAVRNAASLLASRWVSTLTPTQRDAWKAYSDNVPIVGPLGDPRVVGALPMFQRSNIPRLQAGLPLVTDAPTTFDLGDFTTPTLGLDALADEVDIGFDNTDDWANEDDSALLVYVSRPVNPSVQFFKGPYRLAGTIDGDSVTPPTSPTSLSAPFPFAIGNRIYAQFRVSRADGRLSSAQRLGTTAA